MLKTGPEIERLRAAAVSLERVLADLDTIMKPGVSTLDVDNVAELSLKRHGLEGVLAGYRGYPSVTCTSVNNVAAHGLPGDYALRPGDIVTVDISADRGGWKADAAWTYAVGPQKPENRRLLRTAWQCTMAGALAAVPGARLGDVGQAIEEIASRNGCTVVREFTGHGIGMDLHEQPVVPHHGTAGTGMELEPGLVFNVEPVVTLGSGETTRLDDGWSYVTADGTLAAQYEVTVAVRERGPAIITLARLGDTVSANAPPYGLGNGSG
jgi:methionyl aminopeptidase